MKPSLVAGLALAVLAGSSFSAEACNPLLAKTFGKHVAPSVIPAAMLAKNHPTAAASAGSIVGLWHDVRTASDGSLFGEGYDTWDRDGSENELSNLPPATGNYCVGVWKRSGKTIVLEAHVAWLYDLDNNYDGTLDITQTSTVSADGNSYSGPFDAKFFDPNGVIFMEVTGTANAERLVQ